MSRIALNKTRYVAIFEGTPIQTVELVPTIPTETEPPAAQSAFHWAYVLVPLAVIAVAGAGVGVALFIKRRYELADGGEDR